MPDFVERDGTPYSLSDETWRHITRFHPEFRSMRDVEQVLQNPDAIVRSNWDPHSVLYYMRVGALYRVVVVQIVDGRVKTALTQSRVKEGELLWISPKALR